MNYKERQKNILQIINAPIPEDLKRDRKQRQNGKEIILKYLNAYTIVRLLNTAFGVGGWDFGPAKDANGNDIKWTEEAAADKYGNKGLCTHVLGELKIFQPKENGSFDYEHYASYRAYGSKVVLGGNQDNQNLYKSAESDAIKKCASYVGIGAELYLNDAELDILDGLDQAMDTTEEPEYIWTNELMEAHKEEWDYVRGLMKQYGMTRDDINAAATEWDNSIATVEEILPDKLVLFVDFLKEQVAADEEAAKETA